MILFPFFFDPYILLSSVGAEQAPLRILIGPVIPLHMAA